MNALKDRIKLAMAGPPKVSQAALARACGISAPSVHDWISGKTKSIEGENLLKAAKFLDVQPMWLATGKGAMKRPEGSERELSNVMATLQPHRKAKEYPLISWVAAGNWAEACDNFQPGEADEWLASHETAGDHGYWLEISGDSMLPYFSHGMRILVQPEGFELVSGKYYIAVLDEPGRRREATFKQYIRDAGVEYLKPLNPAYKTLEIDENTTIIGRVIDLKAPRGLM